MIETLRESNLSSEKNAKRPCYILHWVWKEKNGTEADMTQSPLEEGPCVYMCVCLCVRR